MESKQVFFETLRNKYPVFNYESFHYFFSEKGMEMNFHFSIGEQIHFKPQLLIPHRNFYQFDKLSAEQYDLLVSQIGMIEMVSYWKSTCSPLISIQPFALSEKQIAFWKKLYFQGLGEFFYVNGISCTENNFMHIESVGNRKFAKQKFDLRDEAIIPIGGGKDSVVSLELLKEKSFCKTPMIINPRKATTDCIEVAGFSMDEVIEVKRIIDPELLKLNEQGFLNGHTPFSAMLAFVSLLCSAVSGKKYIALSNESSANESTVKDSHVNHQYSKSFEFEADFRNYVEEFISEDFNYFSFLRPLNELQIAWIFSRYEQYFKVFRSCNAGSKTDSWCAKCAKCLFVYIILSPFIRPEKMQEIFGNNLFENEQLLEYFNELRGKSEQKPFECVGSVEEVNYALLMTIRNFYQNKELPFLLKIFNAENLTIHISENELYRLNEDHFLNKFFFSIIQQAVRVR